MDERKVARDAANVAYAVRVCGQAPTCKIYHGNFDFMAVVNAAQLPEPGIKDHTMYWRRMWKDFDDAWNSYATTN